jgi:hypothetical protein
VQACGLTLKWGTPLIRRGVIGGGCRADHGGVTEEPLGGGNNAREVVRVGDTVHRARDAGSGFAARVHAYGNSKSASSSPDQAMDVGRQ